MAREEGKKSSPFVNPSRMIDLEFLHPIDWQAIKSDKHKRIITKIESTLIEFKHLYETQDDWKLINQVDKFDVYRRVSTNPKVVIILAKGEMDHTAKQILEYATDIKHITNYDKTITNIHLIEVLPDNCSIIYCHAHKFLTSDQCDMYLSQMIIPLKDGTILIPTISTDEYEQ